jgi:SAM-dependent methyltransferase
MVTSKHDFLTREEFSHHSLYHAIAQSIELYRKLHGLKPEKMNILDWGCGRGRDALWLLERGYNAFGVDVDTEPILNGLPLYKQKGYGKDRLQLVDLSAKTKFSNGYFHFTFSNQSFEHAANLEETAMELFRITSKGGAGYHVLPPKWGIREGHLFMPFIHWLPKSRIRWWWIRLWVGLGVEPKWEELKGKTAHQKADRYFEYINTCTYYHPIKKIRQIFKDAGFKVDFVTWQDPKVQRSPILKLLTQFKLSRRMVNWLLIIFIRVEISLQKL